MEEYRRWIREDKSREPKIIEYKYSVESVPTMLLIGKDLDSAEDVPGFNINLVKYSIWSDGDKVPENIVTLTGTTDENEVKRLVDVARTSAVFAIAFELGIKQWDALKMFRAPVPIEQEQNE